MSTCPEGVSTGMINWSRGIDLDDATYDLEDEDQSQAKPKRPGFPIEPRRILGILAEYRRPLIRAFLISAAVAFVASFFLPRSYESTAQLMYEGTPLLEQTGRKTSAHAFVDSALATDRLREARDRLNWTSSLQKIESQLLVTLDGETAMGIAARAGSAEDAQALASAIVDVFLAHQASFNSQRFEIMSAETRQGLERAKARRAEASQAYDSFREKSGKPDLIQEQEQLLARAALLRSRADEAAVEVAAQTARIAELEKAQQDLPKQIVASARLGSPIDTPLNQARSDLAAARSSLSEQHPTVQALKQRVASLQAQRKGQKSERAEQTIVANPARSSVDEQIATARAALAGATEREAALRVLLNANKAEAEAMVPEEGQARQVVGELEAAVARVDELTERSANLRDAALGPMTGFRVLSRPALPEKSDRSGAHVGLLVLFPILTVLVLALVHIIRRLKTLTVEAPREVAWWGNGPVLGTSVWPRDPDALGAFVDELEDYGVYGSGRTLVVPATETEREIACSFAMRLADAPWLAAAILDVGERAGRQDAEQSMITPPPISRFTPGPFVPPRRLSAEGMSSVPPGRVIQTPPPKSGEPKPYSSRPPRKRTMIGLPAVESSGATRISSDPVPSTASPGSESPKMSSEPPPPSKAPEPFRRKRGARATVRMIVPVNSSGASSTATARDSARDEDAFLLTRPVPVASNETGHVGRAVHVATETPNADASNAVMRAAVRLLGDEEDEFKSLRRSEPPIARATSDVTGVALAWNGPLNGPVLRRAARLAHRVMVVVSSGMSVVELARIQTRLGREKGVGYVLVNVRDSYVDLKDRIGPVEEFWEGLRDTEAQDARRP